MTALNDLKPLLGLELTATPIAKVKNKQILFQNVVYEYPLSKAVRDGYTRIPYAVTRTDIDFFHFGDEQLDKLMLTDGIKCHEMIKNKLENYSRVHKKKLVKPFMLVVCKDTEHAKTVEEYIKSDEFRNGKYRNKTITINSKMSAASSEFNTKLLLEVEKPDNIVEIVIHVNMLKEGWDVNNLYTIVPLRTASSKILREQMVGRGLRLPFGEQTGDKEIDSVMLTAHDKFGEIIAEAQKGDSIFNKGNVIKAEEIDDEQTIFTQLAIEFPYEKNELYDSLNGVNEIQKNQFTNKMNDILRKNIENHIFTYENRAITEENKIQIKVQIEEEIKKDKDLGVIFEENRNPIESWLNKNINKTHQDTMNKFILIPKVKTDREDGEYYFEDFDLDLSKFTENPIDNKLLFQNLVDTSDIKILDGGYINFEAYNPRKVLLDELRKKSEIEYEKNAELLHKLIGQVIEKYSQEFSNEEMKNIIMMHKRETATEIYIQMMKHFVRKEGITKEEVFSDKVINYQSNYSYKKVKKLFDSFNPETDGLITSVLFEGIQRGVFSTAKFDSEAELKLARLLEREQDFIKTWLRPNPREFNIRYNNGKKYEPDFVAESEDMIYLIEVKSDRELENPDVLAKKERAVSYCKLVSDWAESSGTKKWKHVFIPSSKILDSSTFKYLVEKYVVQ